MHENLLLIRAESDWELLISVGNFEILFIFQSKNLRLNYQKLEFRTFKISKYLGNLEILKSRNNYKNFEILE
jgi:hypothetical protein